VLRRYAETFGAVVISSAWAFVFTLGMLFVIDKFTAVRAGHEAQEVGLDEALHGETAYLEGE
jgi:Amt family ammonium transporter